jgi:hypothetical protein
MSLRRAASPGLKALPTLADSPCVDGAAVRSTTSAGCRCRLPPVGSDGAWPTTDAGTLAAVRSIAELQPWDGVSIARSVGSQQLTLAWRRPCGAADRRHSEMNKMNLSVHAAVARLGALLPSTGELYGENTDKDKDRGAGRSGSRRAGSELEH